jgi:hypothetical protein
MEDTSNWNKQFHEIVESYSKVASITTDKAHKELLRDSLPEA